MTEKRMWKLLRAAWDGRRGWHGVRVESGSGDAIRGTPDAVITWAGTTRWVELKCWGTAMRADQRAWAAARDARGASGVVVVAWRAGEWWIGPWWAYDRVMDGGTANAGMWCDVVDVFGWRGWSA